MKVVVNKCYGGFSLSNAAVERCVELGMKMTALDENGFAVDKEADFYVMRGSLVKSQKYAALSSDRNEFRANPAVVQTVEELGDKANGVFAKLKVIDIPFYSMLGWHVDEYDGMEKIVENHSSWD
jgi:hypothetical protein